MGKPIIVSIRLDSAAEEPLKRCRASGRFATTTEIMTMGLRLLARELRRESIRREIAQVGVDASDRTFALVELDDWQRALERADCGDL